MTVTHELTLFSSFPGAAAGERKRPSVSLACICSNIIMIWVSLLAPHPPVPSRASLSFVFLLLRAFPQLWHAAAAAAAGAAAGSAVPHPGRR